MSNDVLAANDMQVGSYVECVSLPTGSARFFFTVGNVYQVVSTEVVDFGVIGDGSKVYEFTTDVPRFTASSHSSHFKLHPRPELQPRQSSWRKLIARIPVIRALITYPHY